MDRQSSTSDNGSYRNCSKIFDPHGDGSPSAPQTNRTLSEMVPWRCLTLALERLLARRPDGILVNPAEPIVSPFRPNGVTIRSQGTKAPVKTLEARDRRSPLTTWRRG